MFNLAKRDNIAVLDISRRVAEKNEKHAEKKDVESQQTDEKKTEAKKRTDDNLRSLEVDGLRSYYEAKSRSAKIFWITLFFLCLTIMIWQLYKTVSNYIDSPIVSTYTIKAENKLKFPIVTICPTSLASSIFLNRTPTGERDTLGIKKEVDTVWTYMDFLASSSNLSSPMPDQDGDYFGYDQEAEADSFFFNSTLPLGEHVRYMEFRSSLLFERTNHLNFTKQVFDEEFGKCYVVDMRDRQQQVESQALLLVFNTRSAFFPKNSPLTPKHKGVYVSVDRDWNLAGTGERVFVAPYTYNRLDLSMQYQQFTTFQHPYVQECVNNKKFHYTTYKGAYTQPTCKYDCVAKEVLEKCSCLPPTDRRLYKDDLSQKPFCKRAHFECIRKQLHGDQAALNRIEQCRSQCKVPCEDWRYAVRSTSMQLYPPSFEAGQPYKDIIYLLVAFSHMEYTSFTQKNSRTADQMIADIGGQTGLWLGVGMMTLFQMPLFFTRLCGACCIKNVRKVKNWKRN